MLQFGNEHSGRVGAEYWAHVNDFVPEQTVFLCDMKQILAFSEERNKSRGQA